MIGDNTLDRGCLRHGLGVRAEPRGVSPLRPAVGLATARRCSSDLWIRHRRAGATLTFLGQYWSAEPGLLADIFSHAPGGPVTDSCLNCYLGEAAAVESGSESPAPRGRGEWRDSRPSGLLRRGAGLPPFGAVVNGSESPAPRGTVRMGAGLPPFGAVENGSGTPALRGC